MSARGSRCGRGRHPLPSSRMIPNALFGNLHPAADRHIFADGRTGAGRHCRLPAVAGRATAAGRFPDHSGGRHGAGRQPETMAATVATPLERQFGQIAGVAQMTSVSSLGSTVVTLQFDLNRNIDGAAQDVQAAITAAGNQLPKTLSTPPTYRKVNPADSPMLIVAANSETLPLTKVDD